jgi:hypothetical protein
MRAGAFQLALLINFNVGLLKNGVRRMIMTDREDAERSAFVLE